MERCDNCERTIGNLEVAHVHRGAVVCGTCAALLGESAPTPTRRAGPIGTNCPRCGGSVYPARGVVGVEVFICLVLLIALVIPGIIFYAMMDGRPYCPRCGARVRPV